MSRLSLSLRITPDASESLENVSDARQPKIRVPAA